MDKNNNIGFKRGSKNRINRKLFLQELKNNMRNGWVKLNSNMVLSIMYIMMKVVTMYHILERQKNN